MYICICTCIYSWYVYCLSIFRPDVWFDDVDVEELEGRTASSSTDVGKKKKSLVTGHITE